MELGTEKALGASGAFLFCNQDFGHKSSIKKTLRELFGRVLKTETLGRSTRGEGLQPDDHVPPAHARRLFH